MIEDATEEGAVGRAIVVRTDYTASEVRRLAKQAKDVAQSRRLLAIAAVLDGALRAKAAKSSASHIGRHHDKNRVANPASSRTLAPPSVGDVARRQRSRTVSIIYRKADEVRCSGRPW
jgi:hypothetical protein